MPRTVTLSELLGLEGQSLGTSGWVPDPRSLRRPRSGRDRAAAAQLDDGAVQAVIQMTITAEHADKPRLRRRERKALLPLTAIRPERSAVRSRETALSTPVAQAWTSGAGKGW